MQFDDVARLTVESDHVDSPGQCLEIGGVPDNAAEIIHHAERILIAVEIGGLKQRSATRFKVGDSRRCGFFHHGEKIGTEDTCTED